VSYIRKGQRPETIYWVGTDEGQPIHEGDQHVYVGRGAAKGLLTRWRNQRLRYAKRATVTTPPPDPPHIYVGTVTWKRMSET